MTGESGWKERGREGQIKTNPLCELVLVAMATIITSHLGEQEQEEEEGGRKKERKKERQGGEVGDEDMEERQEGGRRCRKTGTLNVKEGRGGGQKWDSSMPGGQLSELRTLLSLKQEKIILHLEPISRKCQ